MIAKCAFAAVALAAAFVAQPATAFEASSSTQLSLRSGPGQEHGVMRVIAAGERLEVEACAAGTNWCRVAHEGETGWAHVQLWQRPRYSFSTRTAPEESWRRVERMRLRPNPEATPEEIDRAVDGGRIEGTTASGELVVIPEEAVAVYMTKNATGPVRRDGQLVIDEGAKGVIFYRVPGTGESFLIVDGQVRRLAPGTMVRVFLNV